MPYALSQLHGADNVASTLVGAYAAGAAVLVVTDGSGFPSVPFTAALGSGTAAYEEVVVTGVAGGTFTLLAPTVQMHPSGELVENTIGAEVLKRLGDFATAHTHTGGLDGPALPASGVTDHALLSNVTANQHHAQAHSISGADHSGTLAHGSLGSVTADQHHAQSHAIGGADHSGQLAHTALTSIGTNTHPQIDTALATAVTNDATAAAHIASGTAHPSFATPAIALGTAAAAGAAGTVIRSDATILAFDATVPVTQAYSDAAATGAASVAARRDHKHGIPASGGATYATPAVLLSNTAAAGAAGTGIRSDSTIAAFDATVPSTQAFGDAAAVGSVAFAARRDHKHAMMANPTPAFATPAIVLGSAAAAGAAGTVIRSDGTIAAFDATVPTTSAVADAAATGAAAFAARRDHVHGREPANPVRTGSTAAAATLTLPAGADIIAPITGTTAITAITIKASGSRVTLEFASAGVKVTPSGTLLLRGEYLSCAGRDTLTLFSDGTNWIEMARAMSPPRVSCQNNASQAVLASQITPVAFAYEDYDNASLHDLVTANTRITLPIAGIWAYGAYVTWPSGITSGARFATVLRMNGSTTMAQFENNQPNAGTLLSQNPNRQRVHAAADYIECIVYQDSSSTQTIGAFAIQFWATWIGPA